MGQAECATRPLIYKAENTPQDWDGARNSFTIRESVFRAVVDPGVLIAALISSKGLPRALLRACMHGAFELPTAHPPQRVRDIKVSVRSAEGE